LHILVHIHVILCILIQFNFLSKIFQVRPVQLYRYWNEYWKILKNIAIYWDWIEMDIAGWKTGILILVLILQTLMVYIKNIMVIAKLILKYWNGNHYCWNIL
jgi:hypothetical protein